MESSSTDGTEAENCSVQIRATTVPKFNLAFYENAVPILLELTLTNDSGLDLSALKLTLTSSPAFIKSKAWHLDALANGQTIHIGERDLQLDGALLTKLNESETTLVSFSLTHNDQMITECEQRIELMPRNQWGGIGHMPEMVAANVMPNDPQVERLLKKAATILRHHNKESALDGYRGGPARAWELASAIWAAIGSMGLDYALPPASFERSGQKIRTPSQIADAGLATCLDTTLLICAVLEQCGLNPVVIFTRGHAFAGVWLKPEEFSTVIVDDITALRKRIKLKELIVFETTYLTQRPATSLKNAIAQGERQLAEEEDDKFELVVDIQRARMQRIKPLASGESASTASTEKHEELAPVFDEAPDLPDDEIVRTESLSSKPIDRLDHWQRKLLDLSLRNNLLNFKATKKAIKLDAPDPGQLEDRLADGNTLRLRPRPDLMKGEDLRDRAIHESRSGEDLYKQHALDALRRDEVFVSIDDAELDARLTELYRTARATQSEGGANTLFLAIGFLTWNRDNDDERKFRAPLILIPVVLNRKSMREGFSLTLHDDEARFNPTLVQMLRQDFELELAVAHGDLPQDEHGIDIAGVWREVSQSVKEIRGWEVTEEVVLSTFSFAKYLMWKDLVERTDQLKQNPVVKHLIDSPRDPYPSTIPFPNLNTLDQDHGPEQTFCPLPADSSQLSAVMAAAQGKDFVLIGPPGTGKSQTISNLIAQCLAEQKTVLFVSEKIAALDVVYRRLRDVGLGDFCLELHSSKARKLDVLQQLGRAWDTKGAIDAAEWKREAEKLKALRSQLNTYVERLHRRYSNGMSIYEAIGKVVAGQNIPAVGLKWSSINTHSRDDMENLQDIVERLGVNSHVVGQDHLLNGPLSTITHSDWSPSWQQSVIDIARNAVATANTAEQAYDRFSQVVGLPQMPLNRHIREAITSLMDTLPLTLGYDWRFALRDDARTIADGIQDGAELLAKHRELSEALSPQWPDNVITQCKQGIALLKQRRELHSQLAHPWSPAIVDDLQTGIRLLDEIDQHLKQLSVEYTEQVEQQDVTHLQREWGKAENTFWPMSWLGKRKVTKILDATIKGQGEPNVAHDLQIWMKIRELRTQITHLEIGGSVEGVWHGLKSKPEYVQCALAFQQALTSAKNEQPWSDDGFTPISDGRCGEFLSQELPKLQTLKRLDSEIAERNSLTAQTESLWAGLDTNIESLEAAIQFQLAIQNIRSSGHLAGEHVAVASGECGSPLAADYQRLSQRTALEAKLPEYDHLRTATAGLWRGLDSNIDELEQARKFQASISTIVANFLAVVDEAHTIKTPLERLIGEGNALLATDGPVMNAGKAFIASLAPVYSRVDELALAGGITEADVANMVDSPLSELITHCESIIQMEHQLNHWCAWRKVRDQAITVGLEPLVSAIEKGVINEGSVRNAFETNYSRWWLNAVVDQEEVIRTFVSAEHEKRIADFKVLDEHFTDLTRRYIHAGLCADLPDQDEVKRNSEWGVLKREMQKKRAHKPLRELIRLMPEAIPKLTPCLLMSPLSIAQYLSAETTQFDLVVFDEASQIPVWDAIGAIARGKQVVMVGDPKQMPPTSFFNRGASGGDDDIDEDVEADLESILDECIGANLPTMEINWHYRSRHESLIAFSNHRYYHDKLVTFPSPITEDRAVSLQLVKDGVYEKGTTRSNKPEAKALVNELVERLCDRSFQAAGHTIGVVTFNSEQQRLIEDLLDEARRQHPQIEPYFSEDALEPVFVKNLESVQGDERDIMYFSIGYGPDLAGNISMNFGPMNRDGGERRLNVAITRARHQLRVFSSLRPEQIDLSRTRARGVHDFKHFLEFAERGAKALAEAVSGSKGGFDSPFEQAVAEALSRKGWQIDSQVGVSSFRVDLGVVDPDAPGRYLAGVECDGATYHRSATARDRDKLREQVLRSLGWEILRIWSTDWWINPQDTLEKIHQQLQTLLEQQRNKRAEREALEAKEAEVIQLIPEEVEPEEVMPLVAENVAAAAPDANEANQQLSQDLFGRKQYIEANPTEAVESIDAEAFFKEEYDETLNTMIAHVINLEGPIREDLLAKRIARAHGWSRTGKRIRDRVYLLADEQYPSTSEEVGQFFWPNGSDTTQWQEFRYSENGVRAVDEICMQELRALAGEVAREGDSEEVCIANMAGSIGLRRVTVDVKGRLERCLYM